MIEKHPDEILERLDRTARIASQVHDQGLILADLAAEAVEVRNGIVEPRKLKNAHVTELHQLHSHPMSDVLVVADHVVHDTISRSISQGR
jgi:hypothetical protein